MAKAMAKSAALLLLGVGAVSAAVPRKLELPDVTTLAPDSIYFLPLADELCGEGNPMYYGIVTPKKINTTKRVWVENMGGAICFNEKSCMDKEFIVWLDLMRTVQRYIGNPPPQFGSLQTFFGMLVSGAPIPLSLFRQFKVSYFPNGDGDPLDGEVGFYYPSCTGDGGLGNHHVNYSSAEVIRHSGGASYMLLLQAIQDKFSDMERMTLIGASGSAVSRVAWAPAVADMFPTTQIHVLADSAMHVLPGTDVFSYFWNEVQWSPSPEGKHDLATVYAPGMTSLPAFDWRSPTAISDMLQRYDGRVKLLYISCNHDKVVIGDRVLLAGYANLTVATDKEEVAEEMWEFLQRLTRDAPAGSVFTYISEGDCHHQTRKPFGAAVNASDASDPGPEKFTEAFLKGEPTGAAHMWCCNKTPSEPSTVEMSSAVSRVPSLIASAMAAALAIATVG